MKVLRRLLGYDDKFFDLLEASAAEAKTSALLLVEMLKKTRDVLSLDEFVLTRRKDKRITEEITEQLCKTFVTPLEREDIEALSFALFKIPKTVEKFSERYLLFCGDQVKGVDFSQQASILEEATETLAQMVSKLRSHAGLETVKSFNDRLHHLEGKADKLMLDLVKDLYSGKHEPLKVIILTNLYETLETIIDRCRDAGNVIFQIVLKYS
jgi:uncharacterized protein Yka (UPF0111/DUF47 family)